MEKQKGYLDITNGGIILIIILIAITGWAVIEGVLHLASFVDISFNSEGS